MRVGIVFSLLASLAAGTMSASLADEGRFTDPRDSAGPQDVRVLRNGHGRAKPGRITHTLVTHGRWRTSRMRCPRNQKCRSGFQIYITNDRDDEYERVIYIYRFDGRLQGHMQAYRFDPDCGGVEDPVCNDRTRSLGEIRVWRPDLRTVKMSFPERKLSRRDISAYGWRVTAAYRREEPCPRYSYYDQMRMEYTCLDYAPEGNVYWRHRLD